MIEVVWSVAASEQLREIMDHVGQFDPIAAWRVAERLHHLAGSLSTFPNRGRPGIEEGTREMATVSPT